MHVVRERAVSPSAMPRKRNTNSRSAVLASPQAKKTKGEKRSHPLNSHDLLVLAIARTARTREPRHVAPPRPYPPWWRSNNSLCRGRQSTNHDARWRARAQLAHAGALTPLGGRSGSAPGLSAAPHCPLELAEILRPALQLLCHRQAKGGYGGPQECLEVRFFALNNT